MPGAEGAFSLFVMLSRPPRLRHPPQQLQNERGGVAVWPGDAGQVPPSWKRGSVSGLCPGHSPVACSARLQGPRPPHKDTHTQLKAWFPLARCLTSRVAADSCKATAKICNFPKQSQPSKQPLSPVPLSVFALCSRGAVLQAPPRAFRFLTRLPGASAHAHGPWTAPSWAPPKRSHGTWCCRCRWHFNNRARAEAERSPVESGRLHQAWAPGPGIGG